jgi:hypothetical protein
MYKTLNIFESVLSTSVTPNNLLPEVWGYCKSVSGKIRKPEIPLNCTEKLMSRIEDALKKARLLRSIMEDKNDRGTLDIQQQERGINVLVISSDPRISIFVDNIQSLSDGDIIASDTIAKGMKSLFEKSSGKINECEIRFTARMLEMLCCANQPR